MKTTLPPRWPPRAGWMSDPPRFPLPPFCNQSLELYWRNNLMWHFAETSRRYFRYLHKEFFDLYIIYVLRKVSGYFNNMLNWDIPEGLCFGLCWQLLFFKSYWDFLVSMRTQGFSTAPYFMLFHFPSSKVTRSQVINLPKSGCIHTLGVFLLTHGSHLDLHQTPPT